MRFSLLRALGYLVGGLWTDWGGRKRIEAKQLRNLRRLVEKARRDSPLFRRLYADLRPSSEIELRDLPVTRKPDLMRDFDDWLTIRSLPLDRARAHLRDIGKVGVPIDDVAVFQTSGTSGEPAVIVLSSSFVEYAYGIMMARFERYHWKLIRDVRKLGSEGDDHRWEWSLRRKRVQQIGATTVSGTGEGVGFDLHRGRAAD